MLIYWSGFIFTLVVGILALRYSHKKEPMTEESVAGRCLILLVSSCAWPIAWMFFIAFVVLFSLVLLLRYLVEVGIKS